MQKEFLVALPVIVATTKVGVEFYDKVKVVECRAQNLKEIYRKFPNALNVRLKDK